MHKSKLPGSNRHYGWAGPGRPDIRDHVYCAPGHLLKESPPSVDLSGLSAREPWVTVWNQLALGSCGPHGIGGDIVAAAFRLQGLVSVPMPSRLFIYYVARMLMGTVGQDSGVDNRTLLKALAQFGWCDESIWPYDISRFAVQPPKQCFDQAAQRKIVEYLSVPQEIEQIEAGLANGDTFLIGFSVFERFESPQTVNTGVVTLPMRGEKMIGGHDVLAVGYDRARQLIKFRNSYSKTWGDGGYGYLPYAYVLNRGLAADFWTVKHSAIPSPLPPPVPPPSPIDVMTVSVQFQGQAWNGVLSKAA